MLIFKLILVMLVLKLILVLMLVSMLISKREGERVVGRRWSSMVVVEREGAVLGACVDW
jgi:hypothetical protein